MLSPVFFNIYMDELSHILTDSCVGCTISNVYVNHLFYADDIVLLCPSAIGLQSLINACVTYSNSHSITFNPSKSFCMSFLPRSLKINISYSMQLNGKPLAFKPSCKYLGVILADDFSDDSDLSRQLRAFYSRINYLSRNFSYCSPTVKSMLFSSFCANVYSSHCWFNFKRSTLSKLTVAFNNCFRRFMHYPRFCSASAMYVFNDVRSLPEILRKCIFSFRKRLFCSSNGLICSLLDATRFTSRLWIYWNTVLFTFS